MTNERGRPRTTTDASPASGVTMSASRRYSTSPLNAMRRAGCLVFSISRLILLLEPQRAGVSPAKHTGLGADHALLLRCRREATNRPGNSVISLVTSAHWDTGGRRQKHSRRQGRHRRIQGDHGRLWLAITIEVRIGRPVLRTHQFRSDGIRINRGMAILARSFVPFPQYIQQRRPSRIC